jgi:hypothetical protein
MEETQMSGFKVSYEKQKFDRMERGEHHKAMGKFQNIRNEEINEQHFISDKHSAKKSLKW